MLFQLLLVKFFFFAGYSCPQSGLVKGDGFPCEEGHYCPAGTVEANQYPCLPGTFTGQNDSKSVDECTVCPERFYCTEGTGVIKNPQKPCIAGYYCPMGTPVGNRHPCPPGSYSNSSSLAAASECSDCPPGYYCYGEGEDSTSGVCPPGYFCPKTTKYPSQFPCKKGTYNPDYGKKDELDCLNCTQGNFCELGKPLPEQCPTGTYMPYGIDLKTNILLGKAAQSVEDCLDCPGGSRCGDGTIEPIPCGKGKFSKKGDGQCKICRKGHFCKNDTTSQYDMENIMKCPAGMLCGEGLETESDAAKCPKGFYCPMGTVEAIPCMVGTHNPSLEGQSAANCLPCPKGSYCTEANITPKGVCQVGYYCPSPFINPFASKDVIPKIGSYGPMQMPCPGGTYIDKRGTPSVEFCLGCPDGYYCWSGTSAPVVCPRGSFCPANSTEPSPCQPGSYGNQTGLSNEDMCTECPKGYYCDSPGMSGPRGQCDPGYLCYGGTKIAAPTDGIQGKICPIGGYCPVGSFEATPCPMGTYSNAKGAVNAADCRDCDPGFYCSKINGGDKTGECWGGYYCKGKSHTPMQFETDPGHYSKNGSRSQTPCEPGEFQPEPGQSSCNICEAGYYCGEERMTYMKVCPAGHFCRESSTTPEPCPRGSFSNATARTKPEACLICPKGKYCQDIKLKEPTDDCEAGFFCWGGAESPEPVFNDDNSTGQEIVLYGDQCHPGHYCPQGTTMMHPCGPGTYNEVKGSKDVSACLQCPPGKYCNETGAASWAGSCYAGYHCSGGATRPDPPDSLCPLYHYCPPGTETPQQCDHGQYTSVVGSVECEWCPGGHFCDQGSPIRPCPKGHYCPASTPEIPISSQVLQQYVCEKGTYNPHEGLLSPDNCTVCSGGKYCDKNGLSEPSGDILAGFYSRYGAIVASPTDEFAEEGVRGICPKGFFCPEGTDFPEQCPEGTFGLKEQYKSQYDCQASCPGYYISSRGVSAVPGKDKYPDYCPGGPCSEGHWCNSESPGNSSIGSISPKPIGKDYGDICKPGFYCTAKSERPISCEPGTYNDIKGQPKCKECPQGFFCQKECVLPETCPEGHFCPVGTQYAKQFPCPEGTYSNNSGISNKTQCQPCLPGFYCTLGTNLPNLLCEAGYYCPSRSTSPSKECPVGFYCPEKSPSPVPCDSGMYCDVKLLTEPAGNCSSGYFCSRGAKSSAPIMQMDNSSGPCPLGYFCPSSSHLGVPCPPGSYRDLLFGKSLDDCTKCAAGSFCAGYGNEKPTGPCKKGYFCPENQEKADPFKTICPAGHFCPLGSKLPLRCGNGTYQDNVGHSLCKTCPPGFVCDSRNTPVTHFNETLCPKGHFCPQGTFLPYPCPKGTYSDEEGLSEEDRCDPCPAGFLCDEVGQLQFSKPCPMGFFCLKGAGSDGWNEVVSNDHGPCPHGHYCPAASVTPYKCPEGTYSNSTKLFQRSECTLCQGGSFCSEVGLNQPNGFCEEGYYCPEGSNSSRTHICPEGSFCPKGSAYFSLCPSGTYNSVPGGKNESDCTLCPGGFYCADPGLTQV